MAGGQQHRGEAVQLLVPAAADPHPRQRAHTAKGEVVFLVLEVVENVYLGNTAFSRLDLTDFNPHLMFLHRFHQCSRLELTAKLPQLGFTQNSVTRNCGHVTSEEKYLYVTKNIYRPSLPPAGLGLHEAGVPREVGAARLPALVEDVLRHGTCLGLSQTEMRLRYPIRMK